MRTGLEQRIKNLVSPTVGKGTEDLRIDFLAATRGLKRMLLVIYLIALVLDLAFEFSYVFTGNKTWPLLALDLVIFNLAAFFLAYSSYRATTRHWLKAYQAESALLLITDVSSDAVYTVSSESIVTAWSKGAERVFGYSEEEALGQSLALILPDDAILEPLLTDDMVIGHRTISKRKGGETFPAEASISLLKAPDGEPTGLLIVLRDITARVEMEEELREARDELEVRVEERTAALKEANELLEREIAVRQRMEETLRDSEEHFRALIEHAQDVIFIVEADGTMRYISPSVSNILGYDPDEELGRRIYEFIHPDDIPKILENFSYGLANPGLPVAAECRVRHRDGSWRYLESVGANLLEEPVVRGVVLTSRDVTERKIAEQKIQDLNRELEAFSYSVSHDLRAPLRAIEGFSAMLMKDHRESLDDEGQRLLCVVSEQALKMKDLIDGLLRFSRTSREDLAFAPVDMRALCGEVVAECESRTGDRDVTFNVEELPPATGDRGMLKQVFENLIGNAVKFAGTRAQAVIDVGFQQEDAGTTYFVRDNGVGFNMEYAGNIFGVFQRYHSEKEFEGTGIGLSLVQRIVAKHGGKVRAEAEEDKGATFYFSLPQREEG